MTYQGIDTAEKITPLTAQKLRQEGISFAARYLVPETGATAWKALSASEAKIIRDAGLALMLCWETTAERVKGGAPAGAEDGLQARDLADAMKVPAGTTIYFACDYDIQEKDIPAAEAYYRAARIAAGKYNAGVYGGLRICTAMKSKMFPLWQCVAWSNTFIAPVIQYQWQGSPDAREMEQKVGIAVDLDAAESLDGMWRPYTEYADGDGTVIEYPKNTEAADALKWARGMGIITDDMQDVTQAAVMLWRYHRIMAPEDNKTASGLLG